MSGFLPISSWEPYLSKHPDQTYAAFLRRGISQGFRIGIDSKHRLRSTHGNLASVRANPETVSRYIDGEVLAGKLSVARTPEVVRTNPIGIIPKPHQPGKFRLIVNLSDPVGGSVNDGISPELCSLRYTSVDEAVASISRCGRGALMAKFDLRSAYRMVPVHPSDQPLLGMEWQGVTYCDRALPFGLRSAPKLFTAVADGLAWAAHCEGITNLLHYLDDFLLWSPAGSTSCSCALASATGLCERLGLPVAQVKTEGPASTITFLGIVIDSSKQELRLPREKIQRLKAKLFWFRDRRNATKRSLQSLIGLLSHAASVVKPGRLFIRQLIVTMKKPNKPSQRVRLDVLCKADIAWWCLFLDGWNGIAFFPSSLSGPSVVSDASGSWGCGAFVEGSFRWFQLQWPPAWNSVSIAVKELLPVVAAAAIWGASWEGSRVLFLSDNMAVVQALSSRSAKDSLMVHLLRCLFFFEAHFRFEYGSRHVPGRVNSAADALSRNQVKAFLTLCPQAPSSPDPLPAPLVELLFDHSLSWTCKRWAELFRSTLQKVSRRELGVPTTRPKGDTSLSVAP